MHEHTKGRVNLQPEKFGHTTGCRQYPHWEMTGIVFPMESTVDAVGRVVLPKALRDELGLLPGSKVDISRYGNGLQMSPVSRTAQLVTENGALVATGQTIIDDETVFGLIDSGRR